MFRRVVILTSVVALGMTACSNDEQSGDGGATGTSTPTTAEEPDPTAAASTGDLEAWCLAYEAEPDFDDDDDLQTVYEAIQVHLEALAAVAPDEIADDNDVAVERGRTLNEHLESHDWDPDAPRLDAQFEQEMNEAEDALVAYAESNC